VRGVTNGESSGDRAAGLLGLSCCWFESRIEGVTGVVALALLTRGNDVFAGVTVASDDAVDGEVRLYAVVSVGAGVLELDSISGCGVSVCACACA
jgi:hypothetical protein